MNVQDSKILAERLLKKYKSLENWTVEINDSVRNAGLCNYQLRRIYLSGQLTQRRSYNDVKDTILHEIAHGLVGPGHGHDDVWKAQALIIGCTSDRCYDPSLLFKEVEDKSYGWLYCANCKCNALKMTQLDETLWKLDCGHSMREMKVEDKKTELVSSDGFKPRPYQLEGIQFAKDSGFRCLIADEMGLGKTIQGIGSFSTYLNELSPALWVVKSGQKIQWAVECVRWCGLYPQVIETSKDVLIPGMFKVYIVGYDILRRFSKEVTKRVKTNWGMEVDQKVLESPFYTFPFKLIILDECQAIKNDGSSRYAEIENICKGKEHIIALSGTPIKNQAAEYFPILNILKPERFPFKEDYLRRWVEVDDSGQFAKYMGIKRTKLDEWKEYTKDFIIRRTRAEVAPEIPKVSRNFFRVEIDNAKLQNMYDNEEDDFVSQMIKKQGQPNSVEILGMIAKMRHIVGLMKVRPTIERVQEFLEDTDRKLVVFVHHLDVAEAMKLVITDWCLDNDLNEPLIFHAGLNSQQRFELIEKFKEDKSRLMIASSLAAGEGINLQFCSDCIIAERQWNPANEEQIEGRFLRIGQQSDKVDATYLVVPDTIDEYFTELVEKKRSYMNATLDGKATNYSEESLMQELTKVLIEKNRKTVFKGW